MARRGVLDLAAERATALWNTVYYALLVVPLQMALGLTMALIVNQAILGRTFFRSAYYFPALVSSAAVSVIALYLLSADGLLNAAISAVVGCDFDQPWFGDADTAMESIVVLDAWTTSGTMMLFYLAALQSIPSTCTRRLRSTRRAPGGRSGGSRSRCSSRRTSSSPSCRSRRVQALRPGDHHLDGVRGPGGVDNNGGHVRLHRHHQGVQLRVRGDGRSRPLPDHLQPDPAAAAHLRTVEIGS